MTVLMTRRANLFDPRGPTPPRPLPNPFLIAIIALVALSPVATAQDVTDPLTQAIAPAQAEIDQATEETQTYADNSTALAIQAAQTATDGFPEDITIPVTETVAIVTATGDHGEAVVEHARDVGVIAMNATVETLFATKDFAEAQYELDDDASGDGLWGACTQETCVKLRVNAIGFESTTPLGVFTFDDRCSIDNPDCDDATTLRELQLGRNPFRPGPDDSLI